MSKKPRQNQAEGGMEKLEQATTFTCSDHMISVVGMIISGRGIVDG